MEWLTASCPDLPFASFMEIIRDFEQIVSHSQIVLRPNVPRSKKGACDPGGSRRRNGTILTRETPRSSSVFVRHSLQVRFFFCLTASAPLQPPKFCTSCYFSRVLCYLSSGRSPYFQAVGENLPNQGWIVFEANFKRSIERASEGILSSVID